MTTMSRNNVSIQVCPATFPRAASLNKTRVCATVCTAAAAVPWWQQELFFQCNVPGVTLETAGDQATCGLAYQEEENNWERRSSTSYPAPPNPPPPSLPLFLLLLPFLSGNTCGRRHQNLTKKNGKKKKEKNCSRDLTSQISR